jgi:hypothetical protein
LTISAVIKGLTPSADLSSMDETSMTQASPANIQVGTFSTVTSP